MYSVSYVPTFYAFRYNTIRLWFPQLSTIVEHYSGVDGNTELCEMLDAYTEDLRLNAVNVTDAVNEVCLPVSESYTRDEKARLILDDKYILNSRLKPLFNSRAKTSKSAYNDADLLRSHPTFLSFTFLGPDHLFLKF